MVKNQKSLGVDGNGLDHIMMDGVGSSNSVVEHQHENDGTAAVSVVNAVDAPAAVPAVAPAAIDMNMRKPTSSSSSSSSSSSFANNILENAREEEITWEMKYDAMIAYGKEHGTYNVPQNYQLIMGDNIMIHLGKWLSNQRMEYKKGIMKTTRIPLLERLAAEGTFDWGETIPNDDRFWSEKLAMVVDFAQKHGHTTVPKDMVYTPANGEGPEVRIRNWLHTQMTARRKGQLKDNRLEAFQRGLIDPGYLQWDRKMEGDDDSWTKKIQALEQIGHQLGSCNILENFVCMIDDENVRLGSWLFQQRTQFKKNTLKPDRLEKMQELVNKGWLKWDGTGGAPPETEEEFDMRFQALVNYIAEHGHSTIPDLLSVRLTDNTECILSRWCARQKKKQVQGLLRSDREAKFQALVDAGTFIWTKNSKFAVQNEPSWNVCVKMLESYEETYNNYNVPKDMVANMQRGKVFEFGYWLNVQRSSYRARRLPTERQEYFQNLVTLGRLCPHQDEVDGPSLSFTFSGMMKREETINDLMESFDITDGSQRSEVANQLTTLLDHVHRTNGASLPQLLAAAQQFEPMYPLHVAPSVHNHAAFASASNMQTSAAKKRKNKGDEGMGANKKKTKVTPQIQMPSSSSSSMMMVNNGRQAFLEVGTIMPAAVPSHNLMFPSSSSSSSSSSMPMEGTSPLLLPSSGGGMGIGMATSKSPMRIGAKSPSEPESGVIKQAGKVSAATAASYAGTTLDKQGHGPCVVVVDPAVASAAAHGRKKGPRKKDGMNS